MTRLLVLAAALSLPATALSQSPTTAPAARDTTGWLPLFNGRDLSNFYTFRPTDGKNNDPQKVFKVEDGLLRILDIADTTQPQENGYLSTISEFRNYRLRLEYQWGDKRFTSNPNAPRNSGLLYHLSGEDRLWPPGAELQLRVRDVGDLHLLGPDPKPTARSNATRPAGNPPTGTAQPTYAPGGQTIPVTGRLIKSGQHDSPTDWNTVELLVNENEAVHVVNGHVNNRLTDLRSPPAATPLAQGKIALQAEGYEMKIRAIDVRPIITRGNGEPFKVLVFSKTAKFRHNSIPDGIRAVQLLAARYNLTADATEDATAFTDDNLKQYKAVLFLSTTGDVLNPDQQAAMERYIKAGGGFVGVHAASDTEYDWPWFGKLVGAYFSNHPPGTAQATIKLEIDDHASTHSLPRTWSRRDEWYNFKANPRPNVRVLATLDESTYKGGTMSGDHPVIWCHDYDGGRSWYTALGHTKESFSDPLFLFHLLGGIQYAAGVDGSPPPGATVLFDGKDVSQWAGPNGQPPKWNLRDGVLESTGGAGNLFTKEPHGDVQLHLEFRVPAVKPGGGEQSMGNSGVYLQGRYEVQILDSFDHPLQGKNDLGAIYEVKDADTNAALPAETWQTYDITFRAARWKDGKKTENARLTVALNGVRIHDNVEVPAGTRAGRPEAEGDAPLMLQDHGNPVRFRNIWMKKLQP